MKPTATKKRAQVLTLAAASLLTFITHTARALTVPVAEDANSTTANTITAAAGKATSVAVNAKQTAFFRFNFFDLSVVPAGVTATSITSATLQIYINKSTAPADVTVHAVTAGWTEAPTAAVPPPGVDATVLATIPKAELIAKRFVTVDLTAAVKAALALGGNDFGFALQTSDLLAKILIGSKEGPGTGYSAELEIESTADAVTTAANLASSATATNTANAIVKRDATGSFSTKTVTLTGNLVLPATTATAGAIVGSSGTLLHTFGSTTNFFAGFSAGNLIATLTGTGDTGVGRDTLLNLTSGSDNTAIGRGALSANTSGSFNTGVGRDALLSNTSGGQNAAVGTNALGANDSGSFNAALGVNALRKNTDGSSNTATGKSALENNTLGNTNTATGDHALFTNQLGDDNTAFGADALKLSTASGNTAFGRGALAANTTGSGNTAIGRDALSRNTIGDTNLAIGGALALNLSGDGNTAIGFQALDSNSVGNHNIAIGFKALQNSTGSSNLAVGDFAGVSLSSGSSNIAIGNAGAAGESNTIRIGSVSQTRAFIAGIRGKTTGLDDAVPVVIDSLGQLGTVSSSARYKEDINDMGDASARLRALRPVTFRYRQPYANGEKPVQYGLIAEEVAAVFPELAVFNAQGQPETVKYQDLTPMLLNEVQKLETENATLKQESADLRTRLEKIEAALGTRANQ